MSTRSSASRRRNKTADATSASSPSATMPSTTHTTQRPSSIFPTRAEALFLAIFPATLALGSLFATLSPEVRAAPYSPELQAHPPSAAPSYFARKDNLINAYFVKIGWFWVTAAFAGSLVSRLLSSTATRGEKGPTEPDSKGTAGIASSVARYAALTAWWFAVTQKFFGPPLIDRGFRWTGGRCTAALTAGRGPALDGADKLETLATAAACRALGGAWRGGHDISGHAFMLILGSVLLVFEVLPAAMRRRRAAAAAGGSTDWAAAFSALVVGLNWWMLLMTAAYFHTWFEKLTGLVTAFVGITAVYYAPRAVPALRTVLGSPSLG